VGVEAGDEEGRREGEGKGRGDSGRPRWESINWGYRKKKEQLAFRRLVNKC
jgi:hypothetical protein